MPAHLLPIVVRGLDAAIPEGIPVEVEGRRFASGRVLIGLDDEAAAGSSAGTLDYAEGRAEVRFRLRLDFPDVARALEAAGLAEQELGPVRGTLVSRGTILPDHSFSLSGACNLSANELLRAEALDARVLPGT